MNKKKTKHSKDKNLKERNARGLAAVVLANVGVFLALLTSRAFLLPVGQFDLAILKPAIPASLIMVVCYVLNEQLSPLNKARLVFLRWGDPLPGGEAFSRLGPSDPRIDMREMEKSLGALPQGRGDQNRVWYKLYKRVENAPSVLEAHKSFLFARDCTALAVLFFVVVGACALAWLRPWGSVGVYITALAGQYLVTRNAAARAGERLVCNVLAETASA